MAQLESERDAWEEERRAWHEERRELQVAGWGGDTWRCGWWLVPAAPGSAVHGVSTAQTCRQARAGGPLLLLAAPPPLGNVGQLLRNRHAQHSSTHSLNYSFAHGIPLLAPPTHPPTYPPTQQDTLASSKEERFGLAADLAERDAHVSELLRRLDTAGAMLEEAEGQRDGLRVRA